MPATDVPAAPPESVLAAAAILVGRWTRSARVVLAGRTFDLSGRVRDAVRAAAGAAVPARLAPADLPGVTLSATGNRLAVDSDRLDPRPLLTGWARALAADPDAPVAALELGPGAPPLVGPPADPAALSATLDGLFRRVAAADPAAPAVRCGADRLDRAGLDGWSDRIAAALLERGVRPAEPVVVGLPRGTAAVAAVLGVLKAGGCCLPIDPDTPPRRAARMRADADARLTLAGPADLPPPGPAPAHPPARSTPAGLAFLHYTSGSTGTPKGVPVEHGAIAHYVLGRIRAHGLGPADRALTFARLMFDTGVEEVFRALLSGAELVVATDAERTDPARLAALLRGDRVTVADLPPAVLPLLDPAGLEDLRLVTVGGEPTAGRQVARWTAGGRRMVNLYGPTETTIAVTAADCVGDRTPPLGRPLPGHQVLLLDERLRLVPAGAAGELCVAGPGVCRGYLNQPDRTAERFGPNPYQDGPSTARLYRTGDLARMLADGTLEFLGRTDRQLKIRGVRVEPAEVESVLADHPDVAAAAVTAATAASGAQVLAGYLTPAAGRRPDLAEVTRHARELLPDHLVPSLTVLDRLPLTPSGKVDLRALPAPGAPADAVSPDAVSPDAVSPRTVSPRTVAPRTVAPRTPEEAALAADWAAVLGLDSVGVTDDFFALGGESLSGTRLLSRLRTRTGVELPLGALFTHRTVAALAGLLDTGGDPGAPLVRAEPRPNPLPVSYAQRRMWFLEQLTPGMAAYVVAEAYRVRGELDDRALDAALAAVLDRHEVLRTRFVAVDGEPGAVPDRPARIVRTDLSGEPDPAARARELAALAAAEPFDLASGPLCRVRLLTLGPADRVLLLTLHHSVVDGWSLGVLERDLSTAYRAALAGTAPGWAPLPVSYADVAGWQRDRLAGPLAERQLAWWRDRLAGAPPALELPADRPRPPVWSYRGGRVPVALAPAVVGPLRALGRAHGATLFMTMLAVYQALLARFAGTRDVLVGVPVFGRTRPETEDMVGLFVNTLPMRADLAADPAFAALAEQVRDTALGAFGHQDLPFEHLVEALAPPRDLSRNPVVQTWFDLTTVGCELDLPGAAVADFSTGLETTRFDLELFLSETADGGLTGQLVYASDLFDPPTAQRLATAYGTLAAAVAADPAARPLRVDLLTPDERELVLRRWAAPPGPDGAGLTLPQRFEARADAHPDAPALVHGARTVSYRQLDRDADRLARVLRGRGVTAGTLVGLCLPRGVALVTALLAVLKAGGGYLPLDPGLPADRLAFLVGDAGIRLVVTDGAAALPAGLEVVSPGAGAAGGRLPPVAGLDDLLYVIYTSGSTGAPKGVTMTHRPLLNMLDWQVRRSRVAGPTAQFAPANFDVSVQELFSTWFAGGTVVLVGEDERRDPERLLGVLRAGGVRRLFCPPMVLQQLAEVAPGAALPRLAEITTAGEELRLTVEIRALLGRLPGVTLDNQFGPTEAHAISAHLLTGDPAGWPEAVPVGTTVPNNRVYVLDAGLCPVPVGVPGEVCVGGVQLARGYLGRPDLTADRFVPDPLGARPGGRLYRTGDRARWTRDGTLEFLGRVDHQVKIRGYRVEPGEVEAALRRHPAVADAAVLAVTAGGHRQLAGYVVTRPGAGEGPAELRAHLKRVLPDYMVPAYLVRLPALPLTRAGKLDRSALPPPELSAAPAGRPPRTPPEEVIAGIWAAALGTSAVGVDADFFDIGGHSLLATQVMSRVRAAFGVQVPLRALFESRTVAGLAVVVEEALAAEIAAMSDAEVGAAVREGSA